MPNFNCLAPLVTEIWRGRRIKKIGAADFPRRPLVGLFLCRALVLVNAYKCAKFQLSSSISYGDIKGGPKIKVGAAGLPRCPLVDTFLHGAIVPAKCTKFQLPSAISFRDKEDVKKIKCGGY